MRCKFYIVALATALILIIMHSVFHQMPPAESSSSSSSSSDAQTFHLQLIVLSADRPHSLQRLLKSIRAAHYDGDRVALRVCVDFPRNATRRPEHEACVRAAKEFKFPNGSTSVVAHAHNVGMYAQWYDCWQQTDRPGHYAVIIEDDNELSPFFYRWLKAALQFYADDASVFSVALQRGILVVTTGRAGRICHKCTDPVFAYRLFATGGAAPLPNQWRKFRKWVHTVWSANGTGDFIPYIPNKRLITNEWVATAHVQRRSMPESYMVYYLWHQGLYTIYPRIPGRAAFTCNHRELGMNYKEKTQTTGTCDSPLVMEWDPEYVNFPRRPIRIGWNGRPEFTQD